MHSQMDSVRRSCRKAIFPIGKNTITKKEIVLDGLNTLSMDNGVISMKTSEEFAPILFSLKYRGKEWLDTAFPKPCSKGWWKPWVGGISTIPEHLRIKTILEEKRTAVLVEKEDNFGNKWEGFCVTISIDKNDKFKGLELKQYFLVQPGLPIMFHTVELIQGTGRFFADEPIETGSFIRPDKDLQKCSFISKNSNGKFIEAFAGDKNYDYVGKSPLIFKGKNRTELLQVYLPDEKTWTLQCLDNQLLNCWIGDDVTCEDQNAKYISSRFYIFAEDKLEQEILTDLGNVKF